MLMDFISIAIYSVLGVVLMLLGNFIIDLIVPCHFPTEIKKDNKAVGWLCAGSYIGISIILRSAIISPAMQILEETILSGISNTVIYFIFGIIFFVIGYLAVSLFNKKYNLNEEIGNGNTSAGIMVFGIFVGMGIVISGVIY